MQNGANLVLKPQYGGATLSSFFTSVPVGYAGIASDNAAALVANAGHYNLDLPSDLRGGLSNLLTRASPLDAFGLGLRQRINPWLEGYLDFQQNTNRSFVSTLSVSGTATLAATAPNNPFTTAVKVTISRLLQWLKGKTAHHLMAEFPHIKKQFWGRHMWARGYFCCSSGNVTDEIIAKYIAEQNIDQDEDFRVDG